MQIEQQKALHEPSRMERFIDKIKNNRLLTAGIGTVIVTLVVIIGVLAAKNSAANASATSAIARIESYTSTEQFYETCLEAALSCDFYFAGNEDNVPEYDAANALPDVDFTDMIYSRQNGSVGALNSNGAATSFIFSTGEEAMDVYNSLFTTYQFKPNGDALMHETYQGDSGQYIDGKCVKVYFTSWQDLDGQGNVVANVNSDASDSCIVFRTKIAPEPDVDESCQEAADTCDFYFQGFEYSVPTYSLENTVDNVGFTNQIMARDGTLIGVMNSNGLPASFVLGGTLGIEAMDVYMSAFTEYQFKPDGNVTAEIMHETFQSANDACGMCVIVYFTEWQVLNAEGDVIENVYTNSSSACVVFQTS